MKTNSWYKDTAFLRIGQIFFLKKTLILDGFGNKTDKQVF